MSVTPADSELEAMSAIASNFKNLDDGAISRVLSWASERYLSKSLLPSTQSFVASSTKQTFQAFHDLYVAIDPKVDADKALSAAYWFQCIKGDADFSGLDINNELKNLGHGLSNVTQAVDALISRKFAIQTKKSGTSQQARKTYKLTPSGVKSIEDMIQNS